LAAAVLAALGVTYQQALEQIRSEQSAAAAGQRMAWERQMVRARTVDEAKKVAEAHIAQLSHPSNLQDDKPYAYWILRLNADAWLRALFRKHFGSRKSNRWPAIPSVNSDRIAIKAREISVGRRRQARARAMIRDSAWLARWNGQEREASDTLRSFAARLELERKAHASIQGRPTKWTVRTASQRLQVPYNTILVRAMCDGEVRKLVPETPDEYLARLVLWGIEQCVKGNSPLNTVEVMRAASINWSRKEAVRRALETRTHRHEPCN